MLAIGGEPENGLRPASRLGRLRASLFQSTLLTRGPDLRRKAISPRAGPSRTTADLDDRDPPRRALPDGTKLTARDVAFTYLKGRETAGGLDLTVLEARKPWTRRPSGYA